MLLTCVSLLLLTSRFVESVDCPDPFVDFGLGDQRCYYVSEATDVRGWTEAFSHCKMIDQRANLLSVADPEHYYPIPYHLKQNNITEAWTGLLNTGGRYSWADETPFNDELKRFIADDEVSWTSRSWWEMATDYVISFFTWSASNGFGFVATNDSMFHIVGDGRSKRPYVCALDVTPPTQPASSTTPAPSTASTPAPVACNPPWDENNGYCYFYSTESTIWSAAIHGCFEEGSAELVSFNDTNTFLYLILHMQTLSEQYWIGLQDNNGTFIWEDGTDASHVQDTFAEYLDDWAPGNDCIRMNPTAVEQLYLQHTYCFEAHKYACYVVANKTSVF